MPRYSYGLHETGKRISILDVPLNQYGLDCHCVCPVCKAPFEACSLNGLREPYFRHHSDAHVSGNGELCNPNKVNESTLHVLAKELIDNESKLFVPSLFVSRYNCGLSLPSSVIEQLPINYEFRCSELLELRSVCREKVFSGLRADIYAETKYGPLIIEICCKHRVSSEKVELAKHLRIPMLEINLSSFIDNPISTEELRQKLLCENKLQITWLFHPDFDVARKLAHDYYEGLSIVRTHRNKIQNKQNTLFSSSPITTFEKRFTSPSEARFFGHTYEQRRQSIISLLQQQDVAVRDSYNIRWVRCKECGAVETENNFLVYGGEGQENLGTCRICIYKGEFIRPDDWNKYFRQ